MHFYDDCLKIRSDNSNIRFQHLDANLYESYFFIQVVIFMVLGMTVNIRLYCGRCVCEEIWVLFKSLILAGYHFAYVSRQVLAYFWEAMVLLVV